MKSHELLARRHEEQQKRTRYYVEIDVTRVAPSDLFTQEFWSNQLGLQTGDILRCVASDNSFDFELRVNSHKVKEAKNTITVGFYPILPEFIIQAAAAAALEMTTHVNGKAVPRVEQAGADGWRVIGFAGEVVSRHHPNSTAATLVMADYITTVKSRGPGDDGFYGQVNVEDPAPAADASAQPVDGRPLRISYAKRKEIEKREKKLEERRAIEERNKARTAERQAAEAAG